MSNLTSKTLASLSLASDADLGTARAKTKGVALVTGASSGFGRHIAESLSRAGFRTFGTSRSGRPGSEGVEMVALDVQDDDSVAACVEAVRAKAGAIHILVNNAGVLDVGPAEECSVSEVRALFETNFFGVIRMTNAVLPEMRARRSGRIINIGSLAGLLPPPGEAAYAASKFALEGYSEALSIEVAPFGVKVSLIEPGFHKTGMGHGDGQGGAEPSGSIRDYDKFREAVQTSIARSLEGGGDPREVAEVVCRVVEAERPRLRYRVGSDAKWLPRLRKLLPESLYLWGLRREFGIDKIA